MNTIVDDYCHLYMNWKQTHYSQPIYDKLVDLYSQMTPDQTPRSLGLFLKSQHFEMRAAASSNDFSISIAMTTKYCEQFSPSFLGNFP